MPRTEAGVRGFGVAKLAAGCVCIDVAVGKVAVGGVWSDWGECWLDWSRRGGMVIATRLVRYFYSLFLCMRV